jgi:hypothetical protein
MSLPVSARRQWLVKLVVAMVSGLACTILFPVLTIIAIGAAYGSPLMYVHVGVLQEDLILIPILIFACFWCACAAKDTIRAATWAMPAIAAIPFTAAGGLWLERELAQRTGTLRDFVVSSFHLNPLAFANMTDFARSHVLWLFIPTLLFALIQSFRLFRAQPNGGTLWMLRCILPLAAITMLWSFLAYAGFLSSHWEPFEETRGALDKLQPVAAKIELTGKDLAKGFRLTTPTQRWLEGASITVAPGKPRLPGYLATIHLASGLECRLTVVRSGGTAASCSKL